MSTKAPRNTEADAKYRVLFESSRDAIMTLEPPSWRFTSGNPATVDMFGAADEQDFTAHEPWTLSPARQPDGRASGEKAKEMIETAMREGSHFFEWTHIRIGGETFPATVLLTRMEVAGQTSLQATVRDITVEKQLEAALRASHEKFQSIVDNIGIGVALIGPGMEILELNRQMREWFPTVQPGEGVICYAHFNAPPRTEPCAYCPTLKTLRDGRVHEAVTETPAGDRIRRYRVVASPILDTEGRVTAAIEMVEDVTERMEMEAQLQRQHRLASVGTLARGMAHEINNPVMGIMNYAQLIMDRLGPESPVAEFAMAIGHESKRVATMTHSLLAVTQDQSRQQRALATVTEIVAAILPASEAEARQRGIDLSCNIPAHLPPVSCRKAGIGQAVTALLTNAMEALEEENAGRDGKRIAITVIKTSLPTHDTRHPTRWLRFTVEDNGPVIPENIGERVFDPFFTTKDRTQHPGLGLWLSRTIAQEHGGELSVESKVGEWTRFHIVLPVDVTTAADTAKTGG